MFTGLVQDTARIRAFNMTAGGFTLEIARPDAWLDLRMGESIAINGSCLTLTRCEDTMTFFVGEETLEKTNLKDLAANAIVNLERSLSFNDRLGGHLVTGHVDGTGTLRIKEPRGDCYKLVLELPRLLMKWVVTKGSICLNGISLTVNEVDRQADTVSLFIIPATIELTNIGALQIGDHVNVECDQVVKIISEQLQIAKGVYEHHL